MKAVRTSSSSAVAVVAVEEECREGDQMVKVELEAAEALAGLAHLVAADVSESRGSESVNERVRAESNAGNSWFDPVDSFSKASLNLSEDQANFCHKSSERTHIWATKLEEEEHSTELRLNPSYPTNYASSSGRKPRQSLTEAEKEARKIRRVLANRESARQTIRRRQAIYEELTRKAADLAWENENLKKKKELALKEFSSLKSTNECLKSQMVEAVKVEAGETREESKHTSNDLPTCSSSMNSPFIVCNQPSFFPFVWPPIIQPTSSVQLQCSLQNGIVFPSHGPISASTKPDSSSFEKRNPIMINSGGSPLYLLPCPWLFTLPQNGNEHHVRSFNLNDKPNESSQTNEHTGSSSPKTLVHTDAHQSYPKMVKPQTSRSTEAIPADNLHENQIGFPPDGGGQQIVELNPKDIMETPTSCVKSEAPVEQEDASTPLLEHPKYISTTNGDRKQGIPEIHQVPVVCSGKKVVDVAAAAEARKRRKQLTKLKALHCRQFRMH